MRWRAGDARCGVALGSRGAESSRARRMMSSAVGGRSFGVGSEVGGHPPDVLDLLKLALVVWRRRPPFGERRVFCGGGLSLKEPDDELVHVPENTWASSRLLFRGWGLGQSWEDPAFLRLQILVALNPFAIPIGDVARGGFMPGLIRSARMTTGAILITFSSGFLLAAARMPSPGDACSLLTKEDASAALGEAATGPKATGPMADGSGATVSGCEYTGSDIHSIHLSLRRVPASSAPMYKQMCAKKTAEGLAGLGDVACWYNDKHAELNVIKGTAVLSVELRRSGNPTEPIKAVMKSALAKLK